MNTEEALDWMREIYPTMEGSVKEDAEHYFPELKESDDERISNLIYCIVRNREDVRDTLEANGVSVDDALAYLEKQKEQKSVHTAKEMWKEMRLEVYAQASGNRHEPNYSDDSTKMFSLCDIDEIFEKIGNSTVGSQPAEWGEEDEKIIHAACCWLNDYAGFINATNKDKAEMLYKLAKKLRTLRPQPQGIYKTAIENILEMCESCRLSNTSKSMMDFWASIKIECEDVIHSASTIDEPHWKPSEEQMNALYDVLHPCDQVDKEKLESLYDDIKKL